MLGLQWALALMAFVSLNPYFLWTSQKYFYAAATALILACGAWCSRSFVFTRQRIVLSLSFALFLVYISLLPKVNGGITRWFFLIPFVFVLLHLAQEDLSAAFQRFYWVFAASLLPGMLVWVWLALGMPLQLEWMYPPDEIVQRGPTPYFMRPGVIFLPTNGMLLPNGGTIFRLCAIYDEPGTVGTIAALCLAANRFRVDVRGVICFVGGLMSFSIAFAILATVGFAATAVASKEFRLIVFALVSALVGSIPASGLTIRTDDPNRWTSITLVLPPSHPDWNKDKPGARPFGLWDDVELRQSNVLDNRALPAMRSLFDKYAQSGASTLLFGIASNASNVYAGESASWLQIPINYGFVGFAWLFVLFAMPTFWLWQAGRLSAGGAIFCCLFLMSFYQRPVIWLPAQLLFYCAGLYLDHRTVVHPGDKRKQRRQDG